MKTRRTKRGEMFEYMLPLKEENEDFIDGNLQEEGE